MSFIPGKIVRKIRLKNGKEVVIRYPKWEDLEELTSYINELSKEDTYIIYSGEEITKEKEADFLANRFKEIEFGDCVILIAVIGGKIAGIVYVGRDKRGKSRTKHVARLGISVRKQFRGVGLGRALLKTVITEVKQKLEGIKMITLEVYSENERAINLYKSEGFEEYGRLKKGVFYRGRYIDEIRMVLYLEKF